jgi:hypothetical protein
VVFRELQLSQAGSEIRGVLPEVTRCRAIVEHLVSEMPSTVRSRFMGSISKATETTHEWLHARLGAFNRSLRSTEPGVAIHAGVCELAEQHGVLVVGETGSGKSTLVTALAARQAALVVSDDTVWLHGKDATGIGGPVTIRSGSPLYPSLRDLWYFEEGDRMMALPSDLGAPPTTDRARIDSIVFPQGIAAESVRELSPSETLCRLLESIRVTCSAKDLLELAHLASSCRSATMTYPDLESSLRLVADFLGVDQPEILEPNLVRADAMTSSGFTEDVVAVRFEDEVVIWGELAGKAIHLKGWRSDNVLPAGEARGQLTALGLMKQGLSRC